MGITISDLRPALVMGAVLGGGGFAVARFSPIENNYKNGWPTGGPLEGSDIKRALGVGMLGLVLGAPMGLVGAVGADVPKSALGPALLAGALGGAALGAGLVLGGAMRD